MSLPGINKNFSFCVFLSLFLISFLCFTNSFASEKKEVDINSSSLSWVGSKVTGSHEGTIKLASSFLSFDNDLLSGGSFIIDMKTIVCTDLSGEGKASLENHLMSDDFFGVEKHPYASLNIVDAIRGVGENYNIVAIIEIKGITKKISFDAKVNNKSAKAKIIIDRTEFGIIYKSGNFFKEIADKAIYDDFELSIDLRF